MSPRILLACLFLLTACGPAPGPDPAARAAPGSAGVASTAAVVPRDAGALREAATRALAEQRIYAPAGDNAIEHYLALRELSPGDEAVQLALLELLPYPVIASEQAIGRGELGEARRLIDLVGRADPRAPALSRLRDALAGAEADEARRVVALAEAEKQRELDAARAAAEAMGDAPEAPSSPAESAASASPPGDRPALPAVGPVAGSARPPADAPTAAASAPPEAQAAPPAIAAAPAAARPPANAAPAAPRVASAPPPRYPALALRRRIEGEVTLVFTIRPDGTVEAPRVVAASPSGVFEEAALAAIQRWRFEPVARPVESRQVLRFRLPGRPGA